MFPLVYGPVKCAVDQWKSPSTGLSDQQFLPEASNIFSLMYSSYCHSFAQLACDWLWIAVKQCVLKIDWSCLRQSSIKQYCCLEVESCGVCVCGGGSIAISFQGFPFSCFHHFSTYDYMPHSSKCCYRSLNFHASEGQILLGRDTSLVKKKKTHKRRKYTGKNHESACFNSHGRCQMSGWCMMARTTWCCASDVSSTKSQLPWSVLATSSIMWCVAHEKSIIVELCR